MKPPVLTSPKQLDDYVGQVVTISGVVSDTKIPTILGVDVQSNKPDLRGNLAEATGLLEKRTVTPEEIEKANYANRGPGVFYRLKDLEADNEAAVRPVTTDP